jgi:hypothetical protein
MGSHAHFSARRCYLYCNNNAENVIEYIVRLSWHVLVLENVGTGGKQAVIAKTNYFVETTVVNS